MRLDSPARPASAPLSQPSPTCRTCQPTPPPILASKSDNGRPTPSASESTPRSPLLSRSRSRRAPSAPPARPRASTASRPPSASDSPPSPRSGPPALPTLPTPLPPPSGSSETGALFPRLQPLPQLRHQLRRLVLSETGPTSPRGQRRASSKNVPCRWRRAASQRHSSPSRSGPGTTYRWKLMRPPTSLT